MPRKHIHILVRLHRPYFRGQNLSNIDGRQRNVVGKPIPSGMNDAVVQHRLQEFMGSCDGTFAPDHAN